MITVWAIGLGFSASDIWQLNHEAALAAEREQSALVQLKGMALAARPQLPGLDQALDRYAAAASTEWEQYANAQMLPGGAQALEEMRSVVITSARRSALSSLLLGKVMTDLDALEDARNDRLAIGRLGVNEYKWFLLLFLTALSQVTIAAVHADRPSGGRLSLGLLASIIPSPTSAAKCVVRPSWPDRIRAGSPDDAGTARQLDQTMIKAGLFALGSSVSLLILALHANPYLGMAHIAVPF